MLNQRIKPIPLVGDPSSKLARGDRRQVAPGRASRRLRQPMLMICERSKESRESTPSHCRLGHKFRG
jgi:hypothetical protein